MPTVLILRWVDGSRGSCGLARARHGRASNGPAPSSELSVARGVQVLWDHAEYLADDNESHGYASLIAWINPDYDASKPTGLQLAAQRISKMTTTPKTSEYKPKQITVRIAAVQYLLRSIHDWNGFENQVRFVMKAAGDYKPQFVLLPEIFTTQLLSFMDTSDLHPAVRNMNDYTTRYIELFRELAAQWNVHVIGGSHPTIRDGKLLNTAYLFTPEGKVFTQDKIHLTRWEKEKRENGKGTRVSTCRCLTPHTAVSPS